MTQVTIWTDYQKALKRLERLTVDEPGQAIATQIQIRSQQLAEKERVFKFNGYQDPVHKGVKKKEKADKAAKTAAECKGRKSPPWSSISHLKTKSTQARESETTQWLQVKLAEGKARNHTDVQKRIVTLGASQSAKISRFKVLSTESWACCRGSVFYLHSMGGWIPPSAGGATTQTRPWNT